MAFYFKLEDADGMPADPATLHMVVPHWRPGDTIPLGADRALRVVDVRLEEETHVLVVESA
jgi:hypothetical protein